MRRLPTGLLVAVLVTISPAPAFASGDAVLRDCAEDEQLSRTYSQRDYRDALDTMSADVRQYTNCQAVIRQAQLAAAAGGGSGGPGRTGGDLSGLPGLPGGDPGAGGGQTPEQVVAQATPEQRRELSRATAQPPAPVTLPGTDPIDPAAAGRVPGIEAVGELPTPLRLLIVLTTAGAVALGVAQIRSRVGARRIA